MCQDVCACAGIGASLCSFDSVFLPLCVRAHSRRERREGAGSASEGGSILRCQYRGLTGRSLGKRERVLDIEKSDL